MSGPTPREQARAANLTRIKDLALTQLASTSASELSLRAIARELGIVSSAIYRYYPSRDDLVTALIIDAYDDLADALLAAPLDAPLDAAPARSARRRGVADTLLAAPPAAPPERGRGVADRWVAVCGAFRDWAQAQPHRFGLIYGSAIPGYHAPADTIAPAGRVVTALFAPLAGQAEPAARRHTGELSAQLATVSAAVAPELSAEAMLVATGAFARLIGFLTLELGGHFVGGYDPADDLFAALVTADAQALGLD